MRLFMKDRVVFIKKKKLNVLTIAILTALIVVLLMTYAVKFYIPYIQMKCSSKANIILNSIINESVKKELENVSYENLANVSYNSEGEVKAILCDTVKMSIIKHNISQNIVNELKKDNSFYITVPLVYISSNPLILSRL